MFEAKLRSKIQKNLPLQDFSKALIIAINTTADTLIIGTNLHLSENTRQQLCLYSQKTGLKIKIIEGKVIDNWLKSRLKETDIVSDDLQKLLKNAISGACDDSLTDLSEITNYIENRAALSELLGNDRKQSLISAKSILLSKQKSIIISGNAGVGKSFFVQVLKSELENEAIIIQIDMKTCPTPRTVFLNLIAQTWNLSPETLDSIESHNFEEAISCVGNNTVDYRVVNSVMDAFGKNIQEYNENGDVFNYYLIRYLCELYEILNKKKRHIVNIINCNSASSDLLDFLIQLIVSLSVHIRFIIELRTSIYVDRMMENNVWEKYVMNFKKLVDPTCIFEIKELKKSDTYSFMASLYEEGVLDDLVKNYIYKQTNALPLFIEAFINYLNISKIVKGIPKELQLCCAPLSLTFN